MTKEAEIANSTATVKIAKVRPPAPIPALIQRNKCLK